jgi:hypothetical protein
MSVVVTMRADFVVLVIRKSKDHRLSQHGHGLADGDLIGYLGRLLGLNPES